MARLSVLAATIHNIGVYEEKRRCRAVVVKNQRSLWAPWPVTALLKEEEHAHHTGSDFGVLFGWSFYEGCHYFGSILSAPDVWKPHIRLDILRYLIFMAVCMYNCTPTVDDRNSA